MSESIAEPAHRLTNLKISQEYRDREFWLMPKDFTAAFIYWVIKQSPYDTPDIKEALATFDAYIHCVFNSDGSKEVIMMFNYDRIHELVSEDIFHSLPDIAALNVPRSGHNAQFVTSSRYDGPAPDDDFIDLGALARNVAYMVMKESIING